MEPDGAIAASKHSQDLQSALDAFLVALGDDVQLKTTHLYLAYRRPKNFACVEVHVEGAGFDDVSITYDDVRGEWNGPVGILRRLATLEGMRIVRGTKPGWVAGRFGAARMSAAEPDSAVSQIPIGIDTESIRPCWTSAIPTSTAWQCPKHHAISSGQRSSVGPTACQVGCRERSQGSGYCRGSRGIAR
jgi:hypothetical protein